VGGQLMGAEPDQFAAGAVKLVEAGFDVVDINFGCPVRKVLGRCRGGFHLNQPSIALEIVRRTRDALPPHVPVTLKMRRGLDNSAESRDKFFQILEGALAAGVAAVTVHPRTVRQRYEGSSDWTFLAEVKRFAGDAVILGSGDLFSAEACLEMLRQTGVDGVSVARGAIGIRGSSRSCGRCSPTSRSLRRPRWARSARSWKSTTPSPTTLRSKTLRPVMRKFGIKYSALHPRHIEVRDEFAKVRCREDWWNVLDRWYRI